MSDSSHKSDNRWFAASAPYFPTTSEIGFLEGDVGHIVEVFVQWIQELGQSPFHRSIAGGFEAALDCLEPLTTVDCRRWVFFAVGAWTAFFDNGARGTDAASVAGYMALRVGCRGARVVSVPEGFNAYPATILELYGPAQTEFLNYVRTISAANDGGRWRFDLAGAPQDFEDENAYQQRRIKDKFTHAILQIYLDRLGIAAFDPSAYHSPVLVERTDPESANTQHLTYEQARARYSAPNR